MRFTGDSCLLLFAYICCIATAAAHVLGSDRNMKQRWAKREVQCEDSKLVVQPTRRATYISIITDNGNILFSVDNSNTTWVEIRDMLLDKAYFLFKILNKLPNYYIVKRPTENGLIVNILDAKNRTLFNKEFQGTKDVIKNLDFKCAHFTGSKIILEDGLDINHRDGYNMTLLIWATVFGDENLAKNLVERGANVNAPCNDLTPLLLAISAGKDGLVEYLIRHGASVNEPVRSDGLTLLHVAALFGRVKPLQILLDNGANVSSTIGSTGVTPLYIAISEGHTEVVKLLIARGADVNLKARNGLSPRGNFTPLYGAILFGNEDIIRYIIESGADVNSKLEGNFTPLMFAVSQLSWNKERTLEVVKLLVDHNADVNAKTDNGESALRIVTQRKLTEVQNYLKGHGAI